MVDNCGKWMKGGRKLQDGNEAAEGQQEGEATVAGSVILATNYAYEYSRHFSAVVREYESRELGKRDERGSRVKGPTVHLAESAKR